MSNVLNLAILLVVFVTNSNESQNLKGSTQSSEDCVDVQTQSYCLSYQQLCIQHERYNLYMYSYCKKTCGICKEKESCSDQTGSQGLNCANWKIAGYCNEQSIYYASMSSICRKTCGFCSKPSTKKPKTTALPKKPTTSTKSVTGAPKNLFAECGRNKLHERTMNKDAFMIGGDEAAPNTWVWQVGIYFYKEFVCGGTLISPNYVLTAAHCVIYREAKGTTVKVGDYIRDEMDENEKELEVESIVYHKEYSDESLDNDIALIKLKTNVKYNDDVGVACLPKANILVNTTCYITGWGRLAPGGLSANILNEAQMPIINNKKCGEKNKDDLGVSKITENMLCAGFDSGSKVSGCQGDSGGPLVCKNNNSWTLEGVVSWGSGVCDASHRYTVFTKVTRYIDWIKSNMK
ncbi:chymotrypsinogen A isoform X2 [Hydra vulgaris]|uniref:Chymotrypsinogen A isoform X2 n=1 Tax=Hydra vulgaris TaxID=6087 RepID=A0ABM4D7V7_HYDVU